MPITDSSKENLKKRLSKAMGHLNHVYKMVDEKRYCIDVLHQMKAVQSALDKVSEEILRQHLETCVTDAMQNQDGQRVIDELVEVFRRAPELELGDWKPETLVRLKPKSKPVHEQALDESENAKSCCH